MPAGGRSPGRRSSSSSGSQRKRREPREAQEAPMNNEMVSYKQETVAPAKPFVNRDPSQTRLIVGVSVPDSPLITSVIEYAQTLSEPYLFNHAMRSWLFAEAIGRIKGIDYDHEVLAIGTILHDIGLPAGLSRPNRSEPHVPASPPHFLNHPLQS